MISTDFAPNEFWDDAILSLQLLFQPWLWSRGKEIQDAGSKIQELLYKSDESRHSGRVSRRDPARLPARQESINPSTHLFLTGRAALYYYLRALNLPKDTDVIIQAFTCEAVPLPIIANGLNPIYIDIEEQTFSMDIENLQKKLTPNAKVLILQHTYGFTPKFRNEILAFAKEKNLMILEDLAHGFNPDILKAASHKPLAISYLLSFGRSKAFSSVFGGAVVTNDANISTRLSEIEKQLAMPSTSFIARTLLYKPLTVLIKSTYDIYLGKILHKILNAFKLLIPEITDKEKRGEYDRIFAKAYPNALAILLLHQLKQYPETMKQRAENAKKYDEYFKSYKGAISYKPSAISYLSRFPLLVKNRDELLNNAARKNIYLGKWYDHPVAPKGLNLEKVRYNMTSCPRAEDIAQQIINAPININDDQLAIICKLLSS